MVMAANRIFFMVGCVIVLAMPEGNNKVCSVNWLLREPCVTPIHIGIQDSSI